MTSTATDATDPAQAGLSGSSTELQLEFRRLFQVAAPHAALRQTIARLGAHLDGVYLAMHGAIGGGPLSEEWTQTGFELSEALREAVNDAMYSTLAVGTGRCLRLSGGGAGVSGSTVVVAPMFDEELLAVGAAALIVPGTDRGRALAVLQSFEVMVGLIAVLVSHEVDVERRIEAASGELGDVVDRAAGAAAEASARPDEDPWRLAWDLVSHIQAAHAIDEVGLGFVHSGQAKVDVRVVTGMTNVRAGNPGVQSIRWAMEECLDRGAITLWPGRSGDAIDAIADVVGDPRLHRQWSNDCGGDPVATVPIRCGDNIVGVLSLRARAVEALRRARLAVVESELRTWGTLLPLVERAGRGVGRHAAEAARRVLERVVGAGRRRSTIYAAFGAALLAFGGLVTVEDAMTVPARLVPGHVRMLSAPPGAVLREVLVEPGQSVEAGQLLARFEMREDELAVAELEARARIAEVDADNARADRQLGRLATARARLASLRAEIEVVRHRLSLAEVRAPVAGTVFEGADGALAQRFPLASRLGDQLAVGEPMFRVCASGRLVAELLVPEGMMPTGNALEEAATSFSPHSDPCLALPLVGCDVSAAARIVDGKSTFVVRSEAPDAGVAGLRVGMEGAARIQLGTVSVIESLTRPVVEWLRETLWL